MKSRENKIVAVSFVGVLGNLLLVGIKMTIGLIAGAASIISDAINNLTDALSSVITMVGTKLSTKRPNKKHPFGYGRIEYMTSMIIAALILFAGGTAVYESIVSLVRGDAPSYDNVALIVISVAILIKAALGVYFRIRGKQLDSEPLKDSGMDALMDVLLSVSTLVAALVSRFTNVHLEGYFGIAIGLFIIRAGIGAMAKAISSILGERMDDQASRKIKAEICAHPEVKGAYDLIINSYGPNKKIGSVHVEVDDHLTAKEIQLLEREIQTFCYQQHGIIMTIGVYATNNSDPFDVAAREKLMSFVKENKHILQMHGFYAEREEKRMSFDLVIDFEEKDPEGLVASIKAKMEKEYPDYIVIVALDQDFSS